MIIILIPCHRHHYRQCVDHSSGDHSQVFTYVIASRCAFSTNDACLEWCKRLMRAVRQPSRLQQVFAFSFHAWLSDARRQQLTNGLSQLTMKSGMMAAFHFMR